MFNTKALGIKGIKDVMRKSKLFFYDYDGLWNIGYRYRYL